MDFSRAGWTPGTIFDCDQTDWRPVPGWVRGSFGIYAQDLNRQGSGPAKVSLLVHLNKGFRLAAFETLDLAAEAAEIAEDMANWDSLLDEVRKADQARYRIPEVIGGKWDQFVETDMRFDGLAVRSHALAR
jgi:hypothetical protein